MTNTNEDKIRETTLSTAVIDAIVPSPYGFKAGWMASNGRNSAIGRSGCTATKKPKKLPRLMALFILFLVLMVLPPASPSRFLNCFFCALYFAFCVLNIALAIRIIRMTIAAKKVRYLRDLESETIEARTAVSADTTGGISKTVTNLSPWSSGPSGCDHP